MNAEQQRTPSNRPLWLAAGLALLTAAAYILIGLGVLTIGDVPPSDGGVIIFVAAGCYLLGGMLIFARRRWLWIVGLLINGLVVLFFIQMYQGRPLVLFSPGAVVSKAAQLLLELALIYLIISHSLRRRAPLAQ